MKNQPEPKNSPLDRAIKACGVAFLYSLTFGFFINILMLAAPIYSMQVLDRVLSTQNVNTLLFLSLIILLAIGFLEFIQAIRSFLMIRMGGWLDKQLAPLVFKLTLKKALHERTTSGGSQNLRDLNTLRGFLTSPDFTTMLDTPWSIIFLIVLFILHPILGWLALGGGVLLTFLGILNEISTKPMIEKSNEHLVKTMQATEQANRNTEIINVLGIIPTITKHWQKLNTDAYILQKGANSRGAVFMEVTKFFRQILQIAVTGVGAILVIKGELSSGGIIASSTLVGRALAPFEISIKGWKGFVSARKAYQKLQTLFKDEAINQKVIRMPVPKGLLEVEGLYYTPAPNAKPIIKGISFKVEPGESLAIVGASASGKTTLAKLLVGVYKPTMGSIRLDSAEVFLWDSEDKGQYLGYVPQDIELFNGSVRDNIARMNQEVDDIDVVSVAQMAGVHDMILRLPDGYNTDIGFEGMRLSGGQKQRVALARAFFGNPKFVVLDEPNSNLDSQGDLALADTLKAAHEKKITTIIISHRTALLTLVDKILILKDGMVVSFGPRDQVLSQITGQQTSNVKTTSVETAVKAEGEETTPQASDNKFMFKKERKLLEKSHNQSGGTASESN